MVNETSYTATIGLEVHAELKTKTKMFCGSRNDPHAAEPNMHICPVCMGHPGTLPVVNKEAVRHVLMVGLAVGGKLATYTEFNRKNYFYPDIPKGYQISQYAYPLVSGGTLSDVSLTRIHLEEDTARSLHGKDESIIDYNRAGVPLMELVTEPVIHDAQTAGAFARELQLILRVLGASEANMEKGEMRVEANISVSTDSKLGTKVEVKNLNSFKAVESAIEYEIDRQTKLLEAGGRVAQETRGWDENKAITFSQRTKESSEDYRYFPDPDIPSLNISEVADFNISRLREMLPELPSQSREKYQNLGLTRNKTEIILGSESLRLFFESFIKIADGKPEEAYVTAANYLTTDIAAILAKEDRILDAQNAKAFTELVVMVSEKKIGSRVAKDLLLEVVFEGKSALELAKERNLLLDASAEGVSVVAKEVIFENPTQVEEYKSGKSSVVEYLVGQGMRKTKGKIDPDALRKAIINLL